jgi:hypothetical protein
MPVSAALGLREAPIVVPVPLPGRAYDILVGRGLLAEAGRRIAALRVHSAAIVTDERVGSLHARQLADSLAACGLRTTTVAVPPGEGSKSFAELARVCEALLEARIERGDIVVALGGGVVGDLTGFAAAVLRRGVRFVQIPTTLLAQVDSSVGGKTGINAPQGKNLVGAFHQPSLVLADTALLDTLPARGRQRALRRAGEAFGRELAEAAGLRPAKTVRAGMERVCEAVGRLGFHASVLEASRERAVLATPTCPLRPLVVERPEAATVDRGMWAGLVERGIEGVRAERVSCETANCTDGHAACRVVLRLQDASASGDTASR